MCIVPFIRISPSCCPDLCSYSNDQNMEFAFRIFKAFSLQKQIARKLLLLFSFLLYNESISKVDPCFHPQNSFRVKKSLSSYLSPDMKHFSLKGLRHLPPHQGPQAWVSVGAARGEEGMSLSTFALWSWQKWRADHRGDPAQGMGWASRQLYAGHKLLIRLWNHFLLVCILWG